MIGIQRTLRISYLSRPKLAITYPDNITATHAYSVDDAVWGRAPSLAAQHHRRGTEVILRFLQLTSPDCQNRRDEANENMGLSNATTKHSKKRLLTTKRKMLTSFAPLFVS